MGMAAAVALSACGGTEATPVGARPSSNTSVCAPGASFTRLLVHRSGTLPGDHIRFSFPAVVTVRTTGSVREVAAALCRLPLSPPGVFSCPIDFGTAYGLTFLRGSRGYRPVTVEPGGCQVVHGVGKPRTAIRAPTFWSTLGSAMGLPYPSWTTFAGPSPVG